MQRSWREGWYGSGADYNVNPVMGWGDSPGATTEELIHALARFDPQGWRRRWARRRPHGLVCRHLRRAAARLYVQPGHAAPGGEPRCPTCRPCRWSPCAPAWRRMAGRDRLAACPGRPVALATCRPPPPSASRASPTCSRAFSSRAVLPRMRQ
jgi:hypothetical protein